MEKFNVLLHAISRELSQKNLEDLVHICSIEESRKASITSGHHLFNCLRQERRISEENVDCLKEILNAIHRKDLVSLVEKFENLETPGIADQILNVKPELTASTEISPAKPFYPRNIDNRGGENNQWSSTVFENGCKIQNGEEGTNQIPCCIVHWPCLQMSCFKIHFCYVILTVIFILAITITALCWYADVPKVSEHLKSKTSVRNSGIFVIIAVILIFPIFMFIVFLVRKYWKNRQNNFVNSVVLSNANTNSAAVTIDVATVAENEEDPGSLMASQINPTCEADMSDEPTTSGSYVAQNTTGEKEPFLNSESKT